jgi:hypothetical protein
MTLTRRETHFLIICFILAVVILLAKWLMPPADFDQLSAPSEYLALICLVPPLGLYLVFDPDRRHER